MPLSPGTTLGHYDVTSLLGEGGMGQVWQATDTQLNRQVALKILPDAFAADPDRLARFTREAQILASLNHPNIAAIYGIEEAEGTRALVLELVEGPTLADRIAKGPIPLDEALPIAKQIAEALEAAHEAGVIHRDLKPANIKVREDGTVKVLDFGLAKALERGPASATTDPSQSPTLTDAATRMGMVIGTAAYMSPEQARGQAVDKRADIWAFGCVLLEMLTGRPAFPGTLMSDVLAAVIRAEPDWDGFPTRVHPGLRALLERCLQKDLRARWRDIGDVRVDLNIAGYPTGAELSTVAVHAQPTGYRWVPWAVAGVLAVGIVWLLVPSAIAPTRDTTPAAVEVVLPDSVHLAVNTQHPTIALAPDGSQLVFVGVQDGVRRLYRRELADPVFGVVEIEGTEGAASPFFSPDGDGIAFFVASGLKTVPLGSGVPTDISFTTPTAVNRGGAWLDGRTFVYAPSANDRVSILEWAFDQDSLLQDAWSSLDELPAPSSWPAALPGGRALLFTDQSTGLNTASVGVFSFDAREVTPLVTGGTNPRYSPTGHILYARAGSLYAIAYDANTGQLGSERVLIDGIEMGDTGGAQFAVAANGTLAYVAGNLTSVDHELVWVDRSGTVVDTIRDDERRFHDARLSPDGSQIALMSLTGPNLANLEVFVLSLARGDLTPWTSHPGEDLSPVWHPNGGLAFATEVGEDAGEGGPALGWMAGPNADTEQLFKRPGRGVLEFPGSWSPDGKWLAFTATEGPRRDIYVLDFETRAADPFVVTTGFRETSPTFSPDGHWIAYVSDRSGVEDVWIAPFPGGEDPRKVSTAGGIEPVWSRDGSELFYRDRTRLMAVTFSNSPGNPDVPQPLFVDSFERTEIGIGPAYDVSLDGSRFVMVRQKNPVTPTRIRVVFNWPEVFGLDEE